MKLVVGLGNPGSEYERTRHNAGYRVIDKLASKLGWKWSERRSRAMLASGTIGLEKVVLAKPITYMNLSGQAVGELVRWYKIQPEDVLVVYDELDLPVGKVRLKARGSAAGHNGLNDIIHHLHTNAFPRLRIGIGHPTNSHIKGKDHVLSIPREDEQILLETGEERAVEAIELAIRQGIGSTMNIVNADPEEAARKEAERLQRLKERQERARLKREAAQKEQSEGEQGGIQHDPEGKDGGTHHDTEGGEGGIRYDPEGEQGGIQHDPESEQGGIRHDPESEQGGTHHDPEGGRKGTPLLYTDESAT